MDYVKYIRNLVGNNKIIMNAAAVIILDKDSRILLQKRGDDHFWGLPGGIMEIGETFEETAIRETFEETGYHIEIKSLVGSFHNFHKTWPGGDQAHIICTIFKAEIVGGEMIIDGIETLDLKYFNYDDLPSIDAKDHLEAIHTYFSTLNQE